MYSLAMSNEVDLETYLKTKNEKADIVSRGTNAKGEFGDDFGSTEVSVYIDGWQRQISNILNSDDSSQILSASTGRLQANLLKMAFDGEKEATRLEATKYALEQAGLGAIKNTHIHNTYDGIPTEQLLAMFQDKAARLASSGISIQSLLEAKTNSGNILDVQCEKENESIDEIVIGDR